MKAIQEDDEESSSDDDSINEIANMCFMTFGDDGVYEFEPFHSLYELLNTFEELNVNFEKMISKN